MTYKQYARIPKALIIVFALMDTREMGRLVKVKYKKCLLVFCGTKFVNLASYVSEITNTKTKSAPLQYRSIYKTFYY